MASEQRERIIKGLRGVPGIVEAHLPLVHLPATMTEPALMLVLVLDGKTAVDTVMNRVGIVARTALPTGTHLDVLPLPTGNSLVGLVRNANCPLFVTVTKKPWWKLF